MCRRKQAAEPSARSCPNRAGELCTYFVRTNVKSDVLLLLLVRVWVLSYHIIKNLRKTYDIHHFMAVSSLLSTSPRVHCYVLPYSLRPAPVRQLYVAQWRYLLLQIWTQFVFLCKKQTPLFFFFVHKTDFSIIWSGVFQKAGIFRSCPLLFAVKAVCQGIALMPSVSGWKLCLPKSLVPIPMKQSVYFRLFFCSCSYNSRDNSAEISQN